MTSDFEYIVLGLGGIGSAAVYWLSRRAGRSVLGLDQFEIGHLRGESQDHSRIIRLSYHTPAYVDLAKQAYAAWADVSAEAGDPLVLRTGGLDFAPRVAAISLDNYTESMRAAGVPFETLDADEIVRRWPAFRLTSDIHGVFQPESGLVMAARANAAHIRLAREHGAALRESVAVRCIRASGGEVHIDASDSSYRCRKLIMAAGPWSNQVLANVGVRLPLTVTKEQVTYFRARRPELFLPECFPIWIWMDDPCFYGLPAFGEPGPKVGQDAGGQEVDPDTRTFETDTAALGRVEDFLREYVPAALGSIICTKTCLYTLTPDRDFIIDEVPGHPDILVAIGAGHAFKFASLIGRILSEMAIDGRTSADLAPFGIDRPILQLADPPKTFMV